MEQLICSAATLAIAVLGIAVLLGVLPPLQALYLILRGALTAALAFLALNAVMRLFTAALFAHIWSAVRPAVWVLVLGALVIVGLMLIFNLLSRSGNR